MTSRSPRADPTRTAGVILRDAAGEYYAIPHAALARFRISNPGRGAVEAILNGEDPSSLVSAGPRASGTRNPGFPPPDALDWNFRTSLRSNDLWLIFG